MDWPIFVISLTDAHDRQKKIQQQCDEFGITIKIIDAIDGRHGLPPDQQHKVDRAGALAQLGHEMSDGEFACALSHQSIYERILQEGLPGAIILEDDAILTPEFAKFIILGKYRAADFIQMDYFGARYYPWKTRSFFDEVQIVQAARNACLASGYSLSAKAAGYILSQSRPLKGLADWPCDLQPIKPHITLPCLIRQPPPNPDQSSLERDRKPLRKPQKKGIQHIIERWKRFGSSSYWRQWCMKRFTRETPWDHWG